MECTLIHNLKNVLRWNVGTKNINSIEWRRGIMKSSFTELTVRLALLGALAVPGALGTQLIVGGGAFQVNGSLTVDSISIAIGATLSGSGAISGASTVSGTIAPGSDSSGGSGTLQFGSSLAMIPGSTFACYASSPTNLTKIIAAGPVTGTAQIMMSKAAGAIPLSQTIIVGGAGSSLSSFTLGGATNWQLSISNTINLLITDLNGDSNANGIPDWWETAFFSGKINCDANADGDNDGMKNWQEFIAGTNPTNKSSVFAAVTIKQVGPNKFVLTWASVSNKTYFIQSTTNLATGFNSTITSNIAATPPFNTYTNTASSGPAFFFREGIQQ